MDGMWFQVLGPVRGWCGGHELDLGSPKQRLLFGMLLIEANRFVTVDTLTELLWAFDAPPTARRTVQVYLSRLRGALARCGDGPAGVSLVRRGNGYQLNCDPERVDLHRFHSRVDAVRGADDEAAARLLREALGLWRGQLLADVADDETRRRRWPGLVEARLAAAEQLAETELRLGRPDGLIDELTALVRQHPHRQRLASLLMMALHRRGRTAEALAVFDEARHVAQELGIDPSPELQELHVAILRAEVADPAVEAPALHGLPAHRPLVPAQLPADTADFVGRHDPLIRLDQLVQPRSGGPGKAMPVAVITGPAGVGKTALAVHWGHRTREQFPDGQLYVNLRGFSPEPPLRPIDVLAGFLQGLGCRADQIPARVDQAADVYRTLLADRRVMVVLDNAHSAEQVRLLLPGSAGCLVVVTSRNQLTGLAVEGAQTLTLGLFSTAEARELLTHRLREDRVAGEPHAVDEIIAGCARLPLALAIVAARAAAHPDFALRAIATELRQVQDSLDPFTSGDAVTDVRAVFSYSYRTLSSAAARLFRLLGVHPGAEFGAPAAASLARTDIASARRLLAELAAAHLVGEHRPGRYAMHDLLRTYAGELTGAEDLAVDRRSALRRVLDHYLRSAHAGDRLLQPHRDPLALGPPEPGAGVAHLVEHRQAIEWFAAEHRVLVAAVHHASEAELDDVAWRLAWALESFLHRQGHWHDWAATQQVALHAAERAGDLGGQAHAHRGVGRARFLLGDLGDAYEHLCRALDGYREIGDLTAQANTHQNLAVVLSRQPRSEEELLHNEQALALYRAAGHQQGQARTLNNIGWYHIQHGNSELALSFCHQAMKLHRVGGDRHGQAMTWDSLGYAHHHLGRFRQAIACYREAIAMANELGDLVDGAGALTRLGDSHHAAGELDDARRAWHDALSILTRLGHPDANRVRAALRQIEGSVDETVDGTAG